MAKRIRRRQSDWRPMVALAAVAGIGWLVLLRQQPLVAWLAAALATALLLWAAGSRIAGGDRARPRTPAPRRARPVAGPPVDPSGAARPLTGAEFEELVAGLLERDGFDVTVSGGAGDRGADLKAISPDHNLVVVQCKAYRSKPVDDPMMQTFLGTVRQVHNAAIPLYVTTSRFTTPARQLARDHGIVLVDGATLADWRRGAWHLPDEPTEFVGDIRTY